MRERAIDREPRAEQIVRTRRCQGVATEPDRPFERPAHEQRARRDRHADHVRGPDRPVPDHRAVAQLRIEIEDVTALRRGRGVRGRTEPGVTRETTTDEHLAGVADRQPARRELWCPAAHIERRRRHVGERREPRYRAILARPRGVEVDAPAARAGDEEPATSDPHGEPVCHAMRCRPAIRSPGRGAHGRRAMTTLATRCDSTASTTKPTSRSAPARSSSR